MPLPRKIWFKLQQLKSFWQETFGGVVKPQRYDATYRMCPQCRGLIERDASVCPLCGASTKTPRSRPSGTPGRVLGVIPVPSTATAILIAVNILLYVLTWYLTQQQAAATLTQAPGLGGISNEVLLRLGAKFGPLMVQGQWWRLVTACFLHAGLLHIGMNMWVLFDIGPVAEQLFSSSKFLVFYLVTGVAGYVLSFLWSPYGISIGASGAIMGMIGVLIGASFHHGTLGREYRSRLWRWILYILIFGLFFAVDNAAHIGGAAAGIALGYIIPEGEPSTRAEETLWGLLAVASVIIIAGSFALMALQLNRPLR
ncbi:MAG TPA: rhomboid family intramembrane serine protease [Terriglobia bacterium]|nr:rhomboid family intramembrane serine protease [Terriglobia bacterium]